MDEKQSEVIIEAAREFMILAQAQYPSFEKGYFRFSSDGFKIGSNASFSLNAIGTLVDPFSNNSFFRSMNEKFEKLMVEIKKNKLVALLIIDSKFNYEIKFEYTDLERWTITKLNGDSGIPKI